MAVSGAVVLSGAMELAAAGRECAKLARWEDGAN